MKHIYFHHLQGTGGSSFTGAIINSLPQYFQFEVRGGLDDYEIGDTSIFFGQNAARRCLFRGHNMNGLLEKAKINQKYITLLRHPYDRIITDWFWLYFLKNNYDSASLTHALDGFKKFIINAPHLEFYIHHIGVLDYQNSQHFVYEECSKVTNSRALALAKEKIKNKYSFVGITEHFDISLWAFAEFANLRHLSDWRQSRHPKTAFRPSFDELPYEIQAHIKEKTKFDCDFYSETRKKFEERYLKLGREKEYQEYFDRNNKVLDWTQQRRGMDYRLLKKRLSLLDYDQICSKRVAFAGIGSDFIKLVRDGVIELRDDAILLDNHLEVDFDGISIQPIDARTCSDIDGIVITSSSFHHEISQQIANLNKHLARQLFVL